MSHPLVLGFMFALRLFLVLINVGLLLMANLIQRPGIREAHLHQPGRIGHLHRLLVGGVPLPRTRKAPFEALNRPSTPSGLGRKFICRNPSCLRISCLTCSAPWFDPHICRTSSTQTQQEAYEHFISARITEAIKRVCLNCNTAFVKASGCNKLTCPCGHSMCNLCRADLTPRSNKSGSGDRESAYAHFCPHFRPNPGDKCVECDKCELYRDENDDEVIGKAKEDAVREWRTRVGFTDGVEALPEGNAGAAVVKRRPWFARSVSATMGGA